MSYIASNGNKNLLGAIFIGENKMIDYKLKKLLNQGKYKSAIPVKKSDKYIVRQWYWCGYWHQVYKVLEVNYKTIHGKSYLQNITVQWEDGKIGTHCTSLDYQRDYKLTI